VPKNTPDLSRILGSTNCIQNCIVEEPPPATRLNALLRSLDDLLAEARRLRLELTETVLRRRTEPFWPDRRRTNIPHQPDRRHA
jgi:hypothetical protein